MFVLVKMFRLLSFDKHFFVFEENIEEIVFFIIWPLLLILYTALMGVALESIESTLKTRSLNIRL